MKKKNSKANGKLSMNKKTISYLQQEHLNDVIGGRPRLTRISECDDCPRTSPTACVNTTNCTTGYVVCGC